MLMLKLEPLCYDQIQLGVALATLFFSDSFAFSSLNCWSSKFGFGPHPFYLPSSFQYHLLCF